MGDGAREPVLDTYRTSDEHQISTVTAESVMRLFSAPFSAPAASNSACLDVPALASAKTLDDTWI